MVDYDTQAVRDWVRLVSRAADVSFSSITFDWRGTLAPPSYELLNYELCLPKSLLELRSTMVVEKGFHTYMGFFRSTYRVSGYDIIDVDL